MIISKYLYTLLFFCCSIQYAFSGITCPDDVSYHCSMVNIGIPDSPAAHGTGAHLFLQIRYIDDVSLNPCNVGTISRTWYVDLNENDSMDADEPYCSQLLTFSGYEVDINIQYPEDIILSCIDDVDYGTPQIDAGSCDMIGVRFTDEVYENSATECYKILRKYRICNYCTYDPDNPEWNGEGLWEHTQVIKVVDNDKPEFNHCRDSIITLQENCKTSITLSKSAFDIGDCPATSLIWNIEVDIDLDGIIDFLYGNDQSGSFFIDEIPNNEIVEIELPGLYDRGYVEVTWKVSDACGNHGICVEKLLIKDTQSPTPYCVHPLFFTLDGKGGDSLLIPASIFDYGSYDNCPGDLKVSYSTDVNDTLKVIKCGQTGVQLDRIYVTDQAGNQEFCSVYSFVFDNGSCSFSNAPQGKVVYKGTGDVPNMEAVFSNNEISDRVDVVDGLFLHNEMPMMEDLVSTIEILEKRENIALLDLILLSDHILGRSILNEEQLIVADVNDDRKISPSDLNIIKDVLLEKVNLKDNWAIVSENNINLDYSEITSYDEYDGSFDYTVMNKGDIKNLGKDLGQNRDEQHIEIEVSFNEGLISFSNIESFISHGFLIKTPSDLTGNLSYLAQESVVLEGREVFLSIKQEDIDQGMLQWEVESNITDISDLERILDISILDENLREYEISYIEIGENIEVDHSEIKIYPTLTDGILHLSGKNILNVDLINTSGRSLTFDLHQISDDHYTLDLKDYKGIMNVKITTENSIITKRAIKF